MRAIVVEFAGEDDSAAAASSTGQAPRARAGRARRRIAREGRLAAAPDPGRPRSIGRAGSRASGRRLSSHVAARARAQLAQDPRGRAPDVQPLDRVGAVADAASRRSPLDDLDRCGGQERRQRRLEDPATSRGRGRPAAAARSAIATTGVSRKSLTGIQTGRAARRPRRPPRPASRPTSSAASRSAVARGPSSSGSAAPPGSSPRRCGGPRRRARSVSTTRASPVVVRVDQHEHGGRCAPSAGPSRTAGRRRLAGSAGISSAGRPAAGPGQGRQPRDGRPANLHGDGSVDEVARRSRFGVARRCPAGRRARASEPLARAPAAGGSGVAVARASRRSTASATTVAVSVENTSVPLTTSASPAIRSPGLNWPWSSARASGFSTSRWIVRFSGRAPKAGSCPSRAISARARRRQLERRGRASARRRWRSASSRSTIAASSASRQRVEDDDLVDPVEELRAGTAAAACP